jgi:hypothetical protein
MFLASQKYKALENNARSNVHFFCTYWDSSITVRKAIWSEQFSSCFETYDDFETTFKAVCCPAKRPGESFVRPRCLIIDKRNSSSNANECCFYFEPAFELPDFSVGCREYLLLGWLKSRYMSSRQEAIEDELGNEVHQIMKEMGDAVDDDDEMGGDHAPQRPKERVTHPGNKKKQSKSVTLTQQEKARGERGGERATRAQGRPTTNVHLVPGHSSVHRPSV